MTTVVTMQVRLRKCVQLVPWEIIHRAAFAMPDEKKPNTMWDTNEWKEVFEKEYNVKFGTLKTNGDVYTLIFPSDEAYTMFVLKWL